MINDELQKKLSIFLGVKGVGKTHTILSVAKVHANAGKRVLVIDQTKDQGIYTSFVFNEDIEEKQSLTNLKTFIRANIEIMANDPLISTEINNHVLEHIDTSAYDVILVETDNIFDIETFKRSKIFIVQNYDRSTFLLNRGLIKQLVDAEITELNFVYNQIIECKFKKSYMLDKLAEVSKTLLLNSYDNEVEIPFDEQDVVAALNNKATGKLDLKDYSESFRESIFELSKMVDKLEQKSFKKLVA